MMADSVNKNVEVSLGPLCAAAVVSCRKTAVGVKGASVLSSKLAATSCFISPCLPKTQLAFGQIQLLEEATKKTKKPLTSPP